MFSGRIGALWELFLESFPKILLPGLATTIPLTAISFALALIIAVATALVQFANVKVLRRIARFYIWIFRGTPLLVQLYIVFYGLSRIGIVLAPFPAAVIVFALNEGAHCAETVRGFIDSLRTGAVQNAQPRFSLSKNFEIVSVSGIIEETGVFSWKIGEKMHGMRQSLWIWRHWCRKTICCGR